VRSAAGDCGDDGYDVTVRERRIVAIEKSYIFVVYVYIDDAAKPALFGHEESLEFDVIGDNGVEEFANSRRIDIERFLFVDVASEHGGDQDFDCHMLRPFAMRPWGRGGSYFVLLLFLKLQPPAARDNEENARPHRAAEKPLTMAPEIV
jgi:hypothetical protein